MYKSKLLRDRQAPKLLLRTRQSLHYPIERPGASYEGEGRRFVCSRRSLVHILIVLAATTAVISIRFMSQTDAVIFELSTKEDRVGWTPTVLDKRRRVSVRSTAKTSNRGAYRSPYNATANLPLPVQIVEQYKAWHSVDSVTKDPENRKFALGFYSCPFQAGNRLYHFTSALFWSMVTNRTILWKYWDHETCDRYHGFKFSNRKERCRFGHGIEECQVLNRAPWLASYDDWAERLGLEEPYMVSNKSGLPGCPTCYSQQVIVFPYTVTRIPSFPVDTFQLSTEWARETYKGLHALGSYFLSGLLFRSSFDISESIRASVLTPDNNYASPSYSVALHSRHIRLEMDACDVSREVNCLQQVLRTGPNVVSIMSDRTCTIDNISEWLKARNVDVQVAAHDAGRSSSQEHGPFAGAGYFQDMALAASTERSAFVGMLVNRSSSQLVYGLLEFNRRIEAWKRGEDPALVKPIEYCDLDLRSIRSAEWPLVNMSKVKQ